ncbi:thiamine biosynthesis lipoprotein [Flavobacterium haoranii]|uniref:FAD:protein FMN transferase n=2 Tax=Flavobacterium haoranii TaxID=683124 RepID=A0A1M6DA27_9FLAO|nr:FAD:protein FMN transferase [Flavobacterium haoranii]SHI70086.1 thiamine biosynthesis lipoprotein [Flavobacterium haoranii]
MMALKNYYKVLVVLFVVACQREKKEDFFIIQGEAQGSTYSIKYIATEELVSKKDIDSLLTEFDNSLSTYKPSSSISKINNGDTTVVVNDWFVDTYKASQKIYEETNGLFDPTIGVLVNAYGFGPNHQHKNLSQKQIDSLLQYVGFSKVRINENKTIHKDFTQTYFDFNAIAQGYSVDVVVNFLKSKGIQNGIVEIGGELFALGKNTIQNKNWVIGIDDPLQSPEEERKLIASIKLENLGMATSGNYRKVIVDSITGEKFVHTINPKTGKPQKGSVLSTTILASTCVMADGYATAFMVMNLEEGKAFLKEHPELYVMIMYVDENNELQQLQTENFKRLIN